MTTNTYRLLTTAFALGLVMVIVWPLVSGSGVPAFEQDWQWPVHRAQCLPYAVSGAQPWNSAGLGAAQSYPAPWLPYALAGSLCWAAGPHASVVIYLALLLALAAFGMAWLAGDLKFSALGTWSALAFYLGNPVVLNKIHAGHLHFLFSYAFLPILLAAVLDKRMQRHPLILGTALGLASAQQQFFFFGIFLCVFVGWRHGTGWMLRAALPAVAFALCFTAPQWILATNHASVLSFSAYRPLVHWEEAQSATLPQALRFIGYIGGYDAALPGWTQFALWLFPSSAFLGAVFAFAARRERAWVICVVVALLLMWGTNGPLAPLLIFSVQHSSWSAAIRELYNALGIAAICYAVLIAFALSTVAARANARLAAVCLAAAIICTAVSVAVYSSRDIPLYAVSSQGAALLDAMSASPGFGRYLPVPSGLPQSLNMSSAVGISPFTLAVGNHASALDTLYEAPYSTVVAAFHARASAASQLSNSLAITRLLFVPGIREATVYEPQLRNIFPPAPFRAPAGWRLSARDGARTAFLGAADGPVEILRGSLIDLNAAADAVNPKRGWARMGLWNNLPAWMYERPSGIFSLVRKPLFTMPLHASVVAGAASRNFSIAGCRRTRTLDSHYGLFECAGSVMLNGEPPFVISEALAGGSFTFVTPAAQKASITIGTEKRWLVEADVSAPPGAILALRERFDEGWICNGCNGIHARASGFANAWLLPRGARGKITIEFAPAHLYYVALWVSMALFSLAALQVTTIFWQARKGFPRDGASGTADRTASA